MAPGREDATQVKAAMLPPPPARPPAEHGGIGPEGGGTAREGRAPTPGGGSPGHRSGRGRAGEGGPRPGFPVSLSLPLPLSAAASGSTRPGEGTSLRGRPSLDAEGRSLEASKPEERPPPSPRPPRPPRAWRTSSPLWPAPGAEEGGNCGEGRAAHRGARAPLLLWPGGEETERTGKRGRGREKEQSPH